MSHTLEIYKDMGSRGILYYCPDCGRVELRDRQMNFKSSPVEGCPTVQHELPTFEMNLSVFDKFVRKILT